MKVAKGRVLSLRTINRHLLSFSLCCRQSGFHATTLPIQKVRMGIGSGYSLILICSNMNVESRVV